MSPEEIKYRDALPEGVTYIPTTVGGHNSVEANEAYRRASDATNARWRAAVAADKLEKGAGMTLDNGFKVGDWCVPESFNIWAKTKAPCEVIAEDGRYVMTIRLPDGSTDMVEPFRWVHCAAPQGGEDALYTRFGAEIVALFGLPECRDSDGLKFVPARYDTVWGTKTVLGIGASVARLFKEVKT